MRLCKFQSVHRIRVSSLPFLLWAVVMLITACGGSDPEITSTPPVLLGLTTAQDVPSEGTLSWEAFTIGTESYLAAANFRYGGNYNTDSQIYWWNGSAFAVTQSIPTSGAWTGWGLYS